jgi:hypothetical protein
LECPEAEMSKVELIERDVQSLSQSELEAFRRWFLEFDAEAWDRQIEEDIRAGKLDALTDKALAAFHDGKCSEL